MDRARRDRCGVRRIRGAPASDAGTAARKRRAGADVALLIPALAVAPDARSDQIRATEIDAPRARRWLVASRAHARSLRARLEGTGSASFTELGRPNAAGRARLVQTVAAALSERLARSGCRAASER